MKIRSLVLLLLGIILVVSCSKNPHEIIGDLSKDEGLIDINLKSTSSTTTKSLDLDVNDFIVEIFNSNGDKIKKWAKYSEVAGTKIKLNAGTFKLKAYYGNEAATGFSAIYFAGEENFTVLGQTKSSVNVTCKQANVQLGVVWGANLKEDYLDYKVTVYRKGFKDSLTFVKSETRRGYIPAGTLKFKIELIDKEGAKRVINTSSMDIVGAPNDNITLTINSKAVPTYDLDINITIDNSLEVKEQDFIIPSLLIAKPPIISSNNIVDSNISYIDGVATTANVDIRAVGSIKSCLVQFNSSSLQNVGLPATPIELVNIATNDSDIANMLRRLGLVWAVESGQNLGYINFDYFVKSVKYVSDTDVNSVNITVVDVYDLSSSYSFNITPQKANISLINPNDYDIWAKKVIISATTSNGDANLLKLEYAKVGGVTTASNVKILSTEGNIRTFEVTSLEPGTTYNFIAKYNNTESAPLSVTTEAAQQVGNSGFEEWTDGTRYKQPIYYPWSNDNDKWWDTNSFETMQSSYSTYINYKCFPTCNYSTDAHGGSKSAQVRNIAVNGANSQIAHWGDTQGRLFIGSAGDGTSQGHSFASRPAKLKFWFKYDRYENDTFSAKIEILSNGSVIANGEFSLSENVTSWREAVINLNYSNTKAKATEIKIIFFASTSTSPSTRKIEITIPAGNRTVYAGSCLTLDDLSLEY